MKKKAGAIFLVLAMIAAVLAGCGSSKQANTTANAAQSGNNGKVLVVYYSNTGNTKAVAEEIAKVTGGDLFEVVADPDYTSDDLDWTNPNSRVCREHDNPSQQTVKLKSTKAPNWSSYKTVYVGYPIWWGEAAWPLTTFVKANDFSGKTVIPFATSGTSDIGDSASNLAKAAGGNGNWQAGQRFESGVSASEVDSWVNSL